MPVVIMRRWISQELRSDQFLPDPYTRPLRSLLTYAAVQKGYSLTETVTDSVVVTETALVKTVVMLTGCSTLTGVVVVAKTPQTTAL